MSSVNKRVRVECRGLCGVCAGNKLGPHGLDALAEALKSHTSLTELDVRGAHYACLLVLVVKTSVYGFSVTMLAWRVRTEWVSLCAIIV
eukprot:5037782-Pleurochrysis_carterae.AAC.1